MIVPSIKAISRDFNDSSPRNWHNWASTLSVVRVWSSSLHRWYEWSRAAVPWS